MTDGQLIRDLIVVVPDMDMEFALRAILSRPSALRIQPITFDIRRHVQRDAGCRTDCQSYLRLWLREYRYAMVLFDHEGSGREHAERVEIESEVEKTLFANGWQKRAAVFVIEPELEAWIWSDSPVVDEALGWVGRDPALRTWLQSNTGFWHAEQAKPERPKEALYEALRKVRKGLSPFLYEDIASRVSVERCSDPAFIKFKRILQEWFGG